jgi:hypothetical protein
VLTAAETLDAVPGLTYRQLDHWISCGYLPGIPARTGSGYPREIPDALIPILRLAVELTNAGVWVP